MKVVLSHPTGNANVRAAANGLLSANLLFRFYTTIATFSGSTLDRIGTISPFSEIRRRRYDTALEPITSTRPWLEAGRLLATRVKLPKLIRHETGPFCIDSVYKDLDRRVASKLNKASRRGVTAVYAYEDGAVQSFLKAKSLGLQCLYDLPIGYWLTARRLLEKEREKWPEWSCTLIGFNDSEHKLNRKDQELCLADKIFVASQFTADTLKDFQGSLAPVEVIPYGFPPVSAKRIYSTSLSHRPLKLLFVGSLSQRKGIANLFAAVESIGPRVELTIVGQKSTDSCLPLNTALAKYRWIPSLSHSDVLKLMRIHDVLVFPSLFEGFGLVITEAMSQGTPVITTERTAGPEFIRHGENGWLVEAGSTEALQNVIEGILKNQRIVAETGCEAMETARKRPWSVYEQALAHAVAKHLNENVGTSIA